MNSYQKLLSLRQICAELNIKIPMFFDTDAGHDPDDLKVLVSNLINEKHIALKGVVTTGEFADVKAQMVKAILKKMGREDVKVFVGEGLYLTDIVLSNGEHPKTIEEALTIPKEKQIEILETKYPTYPGKIFGGFYPFQGRAWKDLNFYSEQPDGYVNDAIALMQQCIAEINAVFKTKLTEEDLPNDLKNKLAEAIKLPKLPVVSTGELSNVAKYYDAGLAACTLLIHMGGWSGKANELGDANIFPVQYLGRNSIADIDAGEKTFNTENANIILYMSHLKKQYNLEFNGNVRKLLCLIDQDFPLNELPEVKLQNLCLTLLQDLNCQDLPDLLAPDNKNLSEFLFDLRMKAQQKQIPFEVFLKQIKQHIKAVELPSAEILKTMITGLLPTAGIAQLPHADVIGKALAKDFANWLAQTAFPYIICSDPGTFITTIFPEYITAVQAVDLKIDATCAHNEKDKFLAAHSFEKSVKASSGGPISAIIGLQSREMILRHIISGLLTHIYPGVSYDQFMKIANDATLKLTEKFSALNELVNRKENAPAKWCQFINNNPPATPEVSDQLSLTLQR